MPEQLSPDHDLRDDQIAKAAPRCPKCKGLLVFRLSMRRFQEDDRYVECGTGHVWQLTEVSDDA